MPFLSHRADEGRGPDRAALPGRFEHRESATIDLIRRMRDPSCGPDERSRLRDRAVRLNLSFARQHAYGYRQRGEALDDLLQVAALALVKAVDGFDPDRGNSFAGYATPTILGELKRHFRDRVWAVHVPRSLQERCLSVTRARDELTQRLQRPPTVSDIAAALGITAAEVHATDSSGSAYRADSLNRPSGADDDCGERLDRLGAEDAALDALCDRMALRAHIDRLEPRARYVVDRYFYGSRTQAQIAEELGTSQMSVSRLLSKALAELRARLSEEPSEPESSATAGPGGTSVRGIGGDRVVVTIGAVRDDVAVAGMRDVLVDTAVTRRPRTLVADLRHVRQAPQTIARALLDAHRACGHTGARLIVINLAPDLHRMLCRLSLVRLFDCRPFATGPRDGHLPVPAPPRRAANSDGPARPATTAPEHRIVACRRTTGPRRPAGSLARRPRPAAVAGQSASPPRPAAVARPGRGVLHHRDPRRRGPCRPWPERVIGRHHGKSPPAAPRGVARLLAGRPRAGPADRSSRPVARRAPGHSR